MSVEARLVRLYPAAFRRAWGPDVETEARAAGWRSWPSLVAGVVDMWLHPAIWPARSTAERRARVTTALVAVGLAGWLVGHAGAEQHALPGHTACTTLLLLGLGLAAPWPRALVATARRVAHLLAAPALLGAAAVAMARSDLPPPAAVTVLATWWMALGIGAVQVCRVLASLGPDALVPPSPVRLRAAGHALVAALATAGALFLVTGDVSAATGVLLLAAVGVGTLRDLEPQGKQG